MAKLIYIDFVDVESAGKTKRWEVVNIGHGDKLGVVKWYGPWRCYCFFPLSDCIFEKLCLRRIADFCEDQTKAHYLLLKLKKERKQQ